MPPGTLEKYPLNHEFQPTTEGGDPSAEDILPLDEKGELEALTFRGELEDSTSDVLNEPSKSNLSRFKKMAAIALKKVAEIPLALKAKKGKSSLPWGVCKCGCQKIAKLFNHEYGT